MISATIIAGTPTRSAVSTLKIFAPSWIAWILKRKSNQGIDSSLDSPILDSRGIWELKTKPIQLHALTKKLEITRSNCGYKMCVIKCITMTPERCLEHSRPSVRGIYSSGGDDWMTVFNPWRLVRSSVFWLTEELWFILYWESPPATYTLGP